MTMLLDTKVKELAKNEKPPHENFLHNREVFGDNWELLLKNNLVFLNT